MWLPGCDNPACVFGGNCFEAGGVGPLGTVAATVPANGEWVSVNAPKVERVFPSGSASVDTRTPFVVVFSESMSSSGTSTLFLLQNANSVPAPYASVLIGDGRVLVLLPTSALATGETYTLGYNQNAHAQDRNGQALVIPADTQLASFTVSATNSSTPRLITTWPADNATNQGSLGEILAIFDRPLSDATLDSDSFHVQVNAADLVPPIDPTILSIGGGLASDARVVRWRKVNAGGSPATLGADAAVTIELSPVGHILRDTNGNPVTNTKFDYRTAPFGAPTASAITSEPSDAIGIDSISGPENLAVHVTLDAAQDGDRLGIFLFGTEPDVAQNPKLISLGREVVLTAPFTDFTITAQELDLRASSSPLKARFADGNLHFAFQQRRGSIESPIELLDVDPAASGEQPAVLDTKPPTLLGLSTSGTITSSLRSDMRGLVVTGRASETVRAAIVSCALGDNTGGSATPPLVEGSSSGGLFICRQVADGSGTPLGLIDPASMPLSFDLTIYDRALNHTGPLTSSFQQVGAVGPGQTNYTRIAVVVIDANSRAPIAGAHVYTHEWLPGLGVLSLGPAQVTDSSGSTLMLADTGERNILTVQATGYELFTFDGVPSHRVEVPLHPLTGAAATVEGSVSATVPQIAVYTNLVADSRLDDPGKVFEPVSACAFDSTTQQLECPYDPYPIRARVLGAQSAFAVVPLPSILLYTPGAFLKAASFEIPVAAAAPGAASISDLSHSHMLDAAGIDPEEAAIDAPAQIFTTAAYPALAGEPVVSIEATTPGLPGTVVVGVGKAFTDALPPGTFGVRAAYPGSVDGIQDDPADELGSYVTKGTIDPDLLLRMQVLDNAGNIGGVRPRLSTNPVAAAATAAAQLGATPMTADPLLEANTLWFTDVLPDAAGQPGLYRVVLTDGAGARWVIWTADPPDSAGPEVPVYLPFLGAGPTFPLAPGDLGCRISLFAWPTLDHASFLWTDVEREYDLFSHSALLTVPQPP